MEKVYTALAGASPDFIWIDDDVRLGHLPISYTCFCEAAGRFSAQMKRTFTRETLVSAFSKVARGAARVSPCVAGTQPGDDQQSLSRH